jgi:large subunit ribosomal protein L22
MRVVLDLIRGLPVREADAVLQFTDREAAVTIRKVLASAVANAMHNDDQDPDELFVLACYADEGPTLKRFTPRARGRAGRIKKRTSHITIVVARMDDARLEVVQARQARSAAAGRRRPGAGGTIASRRERVERSRQRAAGLKDGADDATDSSADDQSNDAAAVESAEVSDLEPTDVDTAAVVTDETIDETTGAEASADADAADTEGDK